MVHSDFETCHDKITRSLSRFQEDKTSSSISLNSYDDRRSVVNDNLKISDLNFTPAQAKSYSSSTTPRFNTVERNNFTPTITRRLVGGNVRPFVGNTTNQATPIQDTGFGIYGNLLAREQEMAQTALDTGSEIADLKRQLNAPNYQSKASVLT